MGKKRSSCNYRCISLKLGYGRFFSPVICVFWAITVGIITIRAANSGIFRDFLDVLSWDDIVDLHCGTLKRWASFNQNKLVGAVGRHLKDPPPVFSDVIFVSFYNVISRYFLKPSLVAYTKRCIEMQSKRRFLSLTVSCGFWWHSNGIPSNFCVPCHKPSRCPPCHKPTSPTCMKCSLVPPTFSDG